MAYAATIGRNRRCRSRLSLIVQCVPIVRPRVPMALPVLPTFFSLHADWPYDRRLAEGRFLRSDGSKERAASRSYSGTLAESVAPKISARSQISSPTTLRSHRLQWPPALQESYSVAPQINAPRQLKCGAISRTSPRTSTCCPRLAGSTKWASGTSSTSSTSAALGLNSTADRTAATHGVIQKLLPNK